jgi:Bacterial protein of unknown function (DUF937)
VKSIDFSYSVNASFSAVILQCLSEKIGLSAEILQRVVSHACPVLIASLTATAVTSGGVMVLFSTVMSSGSNARIAEQLADLCATTASLKDLEATGDVLMMHASGRRIAVVSDQIAIQTGVPTQAAHVLTGVVAAVLFGALKHHMLLEQGTSAGLLVLFGSQLPVVSQYVSDGVAGSLGFENAGSFTSAIAGHLEVVSANLTQSVTGEEAIPLRLVDASRERIPAAENAASPLRKRIWLLCVAMLALLLAVFASFYLHSDSVGTEQVTLFNGSRDRPVIPATMVAVSGVAAQPGIGLLAPGGVSAATVPTPASAVPASAAVAASVFQLAPHTSSDSSR